MTIVLVYEFFCKERPLEILQYCKIVNSYFFASLRLGVFAFFFLQLVVEKEGHVAVLDDVVASF